MNKEKKFQIACNFHKVRKGSVSVMVQINLCIKVEAVSIYENER